MLSLSENETKFYDFSSYELLRLEFVNRTFDRDDCANEDQVILSIVNFQRLKIDDSLGISLVTGDIELTEFENLSVRDFLLQQFILRLLYLETNGDKWSKKMVG